jgi:hypothetical protein
MSHAYFGMIRHGHIFLLLLKTLLLEIASDALDDRNKIIVDLAVDENLELFKVARLTSSPSSFHPGYAAIASS